VLVVRDPLHSCLILGVLVFAGGPRSARADVEATERRIKAAGIEDELRVQIHAGIDRAARFLRAAQREDGSWAAGAGVAWAPPGSLRVWDAGTTALAGLAMAHAGGALERASALRALRWLLRDADDLVRIETYVAGPTLLLLQALRPDPQVARPLVAGIEAAFSSAHASFRYGAKGTRGTTLWLGFGDSPNLSTAQFACLGLWAGRRCGVATDDGILRQHLVRLLVTQVPDGAWPYDATIAERTNGGYATGAFMGLANLILAQDALAKVLADEPLLRRRTRETESAARSALRRYARWTLSGFTSPSTVTRDFPLYEWYALEKAAVFAGVERLGPRLWYRTGARRLLASQLEDGSWRSPGFYRGVSTSAEPPMLATAFALLFLLRISETYGPPSDAEPAPVLTPGAGGASAAERGLDLPELARRVDVLERLLDLPKGRCEAIEAAVAAVQEAHARRSQDLDPGALDAWRLRAEAALLKAFEVHVPFEGRNELHLVNVAAARALATFPPRAARRLLVALIEAGRREPALPSQRQPDLLEAAYDALIASGEAPAVAWLTQRATDRGLELRSWASRTGALVALADWQGGSAEDRRAAAAALVQAFLPWERACEQAPPRPLRHDVGHGPDVREVWGHVRPDVLLALDALIGVPSATEGVEPLPHEGWSRLADVRERLETPRAR
jgi:hypothetical protein